MLATQNSPVRRRVGLRKSAVKTIELQSNRRIEFQSDRNYGYDYRHGHQSALRLK